MPSPAHVDPARNEHSHWSYSTIRSILRNPVYLGRVTWDKLDFSAAREVRDDEQGGPLVRLRDEGDWVRSEVEHPALVSDELWSLAQERFHSKARSSGLPRAGRPPASALSRFVRCATGHAPRATYVATMKDKAYVRCATTRRGMYGKVAAEAIEGRGVLCSMREDVLLPFILGFFERRVFDAARLDLLHEQLANQAKSEQTSTRKERTELQRQVTELDQAIKRQVIAIEQGVEPALVGARIAEELEGAEGNR